MGSAERDRQLGGQDDEGGNEQGLGGKCHDHPPRSLPVGDAAPALFQGVPVPHQVGDLVRDVLPGTMRPLTQFGEFRCYSMSPLDESARRVRSMAESQPGVCCR
jgi:hypothetical protein